MGNDFDITSIPIQTLILYSLKDCEKYGYEIKDGIDRITENQVEIKQANLYSCLKKLEQAKLISSYWRDSEIGGKRHYYFLTEKGKEELKNSNFEGQLNESLNSKNTQSQEKSSIEFYDKQSHGSGGFFGSQAFSSTEKADNFISIENPSPIKLPNTKELESYDLAPEVVDEQVLNKKNNTFVEKAVVQEEKVVEEEMPRYNVNDVVSKSTQTTKMQTTDIDYKNILGELYSPEKSSTNEDAFQTKEEEVVFPIIEEDFASESETQFKEVSKIDNNKKVDRDVVNDESYINRIINQSVKVTNFSNFGINVKRHSKASDVLTNNDNFYKISSLRFMQSILLYLLIVLEICCCYLFVKNSGSIIYSDFKIFAIIGAIFALYPISMLTIYLFNPNRKRKVEVNFKSGLLYRTIITFIFIMFVIALNFLFGMTNLNQADYIIFWLLPSILSLNLIFEFIIFKLLLITGKYNC